MNKQQVLAGQAEHPLEPAFRSSAVARMVGMPVATLRVWEQRYRAVEPGTSAGGHRLYSAEQVRRVTLLRQLTEQGHAISAIAGLQTSQLRELLAPCLDGKSLRPHGALRLVVIGQALAARLLRPAVWAKASSAPKLLAVFDTLDEAVLAGRGSGCDLLLWQQPALLDELPSNLEAIQSAWQPSRVAVVYRFAGAAAKSTFSAFGASLLREPADDEDLGAWLNGMDTVITSNARGPDALKELREASELLPGQELGLEVQPAARRFDDAALTAIAGLSPTLACECPRHLAELLMQLSSFEAYSAACVNRSPADARLHAHLQRVAGTSRVLLEAALESVARHEGLDLA